MSDKERSSGVRTIPEHTTLPSYQILLLTILLEAKSSDLKGNVLVAKAPTAKLMANSLISAAVLGLLCFVSTTGASHNLL